jgi:TonB family protein
MKTVFKFLVFFTVVALSQACQPKETKDTSASTDQSTAEASDKDQADARMLKKKQNETQTAERAEQRELARIEKVKFSPTYKDPTGKVVYNKAEVDPSYTGGEDEMRLFLQKNLKYPEAAKESGLTGTVFVDFIVDEKGQVREVVASDVVGDDVDLSLKEESVRVVASMPNWKPGTQHGKAVDASFSIPITFEVD